MCERAYRYVNPLRSFHFRCVHKYLFLPPANTKNTQRWDAADDCVERIDSIPHIFVIFHSIPIMGVRGLWRLLLPIGRRISVETLEGQVLAIDASIWLTQFLNAMRDPDSGSVKEAAHLIGFFRRLAKLRFHGIKPVLVFDGATPEIKVREVQARRRRREQFASNSTTHGIQRLAKRLLVQELKKLKGGTKHKVPGALSATFNLPAEELRGKYQEADDALPTNETSEQIAKALQEEEWNATVGGNAEEAVENDWDNSERPASQSTKGDDRNETSGDNPDFILQHLSSMSAHARKDAIEEAKRRQRLQSRREFMPVAGQPEDYSQVQVRNFLRSSRLNQNIVKLAKDAAAKDNFLLIGEAVASDSTRRIVFEKFNVHSTKRLLKNNQHSDSDEEIWPDNDKPPKLLHDSEDDELAGGGFLKDNPFLKKMHDSDDEIVVCGFSKSASVAKKIQELESDDSEESHCGFIFEEKPFFLDKISDNDNEGGGFVTDNQPDVSTSEHPSLLKRKVQIQAQLIEDEMLARAIQESENAEKLQAFGTENVEIYERKSDETLAQQQQGPNKLLKSHLSALEIDDDRKLPAKSSLPQVDIDSDGDDDIDWEDGDANDNEIIASLPDQPDYFGEMSIEEDNEDCEVGEEKMDHTSQSHEHTDMGGFDAHDFSLPIQNMNVAALEQAQATAANLTDWAGRAFRRAIAVHADETGKLDDDIPVLRPVFNTDHVDVVPMEHTSEKIPITRSQVEIVALSDEHNQNLIISNDQTASRTDISETTHGYPMNISSQLSMDAFHGGSTNLIIQDEFRSETEGKPEERDMETVTDEMKAEIIHLIRLFGIPYVEAPAEAEAQCAALEELGLVDGIVTEDSDVFVFGGKTIYRHIFEDQKYVEVYLSSDAERDLALTRNQFVGLAMLLGGDYTDGVKGVGIVNGMEILQAFDLTSGVKTGLIKFRKWLDGFDPGDVFGSKVSCDSKSPEQTFHIKHRSARQRWSAPTNFPSDAVLNAYLNPVVDKSEDTFSWGVPDLDGLVEFCRRNMGWEVGDTKAIIQPILDRTNTGMRQTRIESFFMKYEDNIKFANVKSKRLRDVLQEIQGEKTEILSQNSPYDSEDDHQKEVNETLIVVNDELAPPLAKRKKTTSKRGRPRGVK